MEEQRVANNDHSIMRRPEDTMTRTISLAGTSVEVVERGKGRPLLFLHAGQGLAPERPWLDLLAEGYRVIAPWHPGYGNSPLIDEGAGGVGDLAYLYLDLAAQLGLEDAILVGSCLGGWIAAEMMVRSTAGFSGVVLVAPLGIKLSSRDERDIADMHAMSQDEYLRSAWANPGKGEIDFTTLPDSELAAIVRGREAFALYGWKPYVHNPHLSAGCIGSTYRRCSCGALKTVSSVPPTGKAGSGQSLAPQLRSSLTRVIFRTGSSPSNSFSVCRHSSTITTPSSKRRGVCGSGTSRRWPTIRPGKRG
jgi:pimeloyl-ACP methyl ester carboxylesterase